MQIPPDCVGDADGDEGTDDGVEDVVVAGADVDGVVVVVVDCVALGAGVADVDAGAGVADCAA